MTANMVKEDWGWRVNVDLITTIPFLIILWGLIIVSGILYLTFEYYRTLENPRMKNQTKLVLLAIINLIFFILISEVGFKILKFDFPPLTAIGFAVTSIIIAYSMIKYKLFRINPEIAARNILASMSDALFLLSPNGTIHSINKSTLSLVGYLNPKEIIGKNFQDFIQSTNDNSDVMNRLQKMDQTFNLNLLAKTGSIVPVSIKSSLITDDNDQTINAIVLLCRDITVQLKIDEERALAEQNRKELEKRRINFITMTSHELRTPLTSIKGYSELIIQMNQKTEDTTLQRAFKSITRNVLRLERLIDGVLDVSQIDEQRFKIVKEKRDLISFLTETLNPYLNRVDSTISYGPDLYNGKEIYVNIDPDRIAQVVNNLVDNSLKNSPKNVGKVDITVDTSDKTAKITFTDRGAGIAPADLDKIFDRFVSIPTKFSVKGSGIGLYVLRMIVEAHLGSLTASSPGLDKGSTFVIELPISS